MLTVICIVIIMTINRSKVKNLCDCRVSVWLQGIFVTAGYLCDCRVSVLCFKRVKSLHRIQKLFWVINFEVRSTCTQESLNSGEGKRWIIYVEETVQWVICMVSRRFGVSCNLWSENVLFVNMLFDMIAYWLIHTELSSVLGPKLRGIWAQAWSGT